MPNTNRYLLRFGEETSTPVKSPHTVDINGSMLMMPQERMRNFTSDEILGLYGRKPFSVEQPAIVLTQYFGVNSEIKEHEADDPALFLVIEGSGFMRVGGSEAEEFKVNSGDAVLWPAGVPHAAWTDGEPMAGIVIQMESPLSDWDEEE